MWNIGLNLVMVIIISITLFVNDPQVLKWLAVIFMVVAWMGYYYLDHLNNQLNKPRYGKEWWQRW